MIATYIQELLATNNRVIVPNYGAFLVRATSKSKDANTLEEKLKDIYFSPFLKFNDELLEKYIIKKENVTKEEASEKITTFINVIKKELDLEKPYIIEGFGQFVSDKQGKVQFLTIAKDAAEAPSAAKKEEKKEIEKPAKPGKSSASKKTPVEKTTLTEEIKEEKSKVKEIKPTKDIDEKEEQKEESKPTGSTDKLKEFKPETKTLAPPTSTKTKEMPVTNQTKSKYSAKKQKQPINKGLILSIAIGLPLAAIFIWGILNINTIKTVFNKEKTEKVVQKKPATKAKTKKETPTISEDKKETVAKAETKKTEKVVQKKPATPQKKYYIIAGSFKNEKYALSYMNKLKAEGYNAEKLDERNGMHAVSYDSFTDKKEALAQYKRLSNEKGLQTWILYH